MLVVRSKIQIPGLIVIMKKYLPLGLSLAALLLSGCVIRSLHPFYTEKDLAYDPALAAQWVEDDGAVWEFTGDAAAKSYKLTHTDKEGRKAEFAARLFQLDRQRYLDLLLTQLDDKSNQINSVATLHLLPAHTVVKVEGIGRELRWRWGKEAWLRDLVKEKPQAIAHLLIGNQDDPTVVLTAPTAELQAFLKQHANAEEAFMEVVTLKPRAR